MSNPVDEFGRLLRTAREAAKLTRKELAVTVGLDPSYLFRLESGARKASRQSVVALAEALAIGSEASNKWLVAAGYAPVPFLSQVQGAVRIRGARVSDHPEEFRPVGEDTNRWAAWLETMGLQSEALASLMSAL